MLPIDSLILFLILALFAEVLGTLGGFGSSLFFVPIASYFLDFHSVLGITAMFHVGSNVSKIFMFRKGVDWKLVGYIGVPSVVFVVVGALLSKYAAPKMLEIILGIILIIISIIFFVKREIKINPKPTNAIIGGSIAGMMAGLLGTGGAIRGATLAAFSLGKDAFIATSAIIDLAIDTSRAGVYISNGFVHVHDLYLIPCLLVISVVGTYIGKKLLTRITDKNFLLLVYFFILLTGILTLTQALFSHPIASA